MNNEKKVRDLKTTPITMLNDLVCYYFRFKNYPTLYKTLK